MEELGNLSELRELGIWWSPCGESSNNITERYEHFAISLYRLKKLQSLRVHGSDSRSPVDLLDHLHHPLRQLQKFQLSGGLEAAMFTGSLSGSDHFQRLHTYASMSRR